MRKASWFTRFAKKTAQLAGRPVTCALAGAIVLLWGISGPLFGFNETWQLTINTFTTIVTFLMVFLIQNTQNRDNEAIQLKLDELIRVTKRARNSLLDLEEATEDEIKALRDQFSKLAERKRLRQAAKEKAR